VGGHQLGVQLAVPHAELVDGTDKVRVVLRLVGGPAQIVEHLRLLRQQPQSPTDSGGRRDRINQRPVFIQLDIACIWIHNHNDVLIRPTRFN
jgi:hypothetical protein